MVQNEAKHQIHDLTIGGIAGVRRGPFSGAASLDVRPHNSTYAQADTASASARASFTKDFGHLGSGGSRNIPELDSEFQENDQFSEQ